MKIFVVVVPPSLNSGLPKQIQLGTAVCREVIGSPLESVRERYAERARSSMERLSGLEVQLHELTKKVRVCMERGCWYYRTLSWNARVGLNEVQVKMGYSVAYRR